VADKKTGLEHKSASKVKDDKCGGCSFLSRTKDAEVANIPGQGDLFFPSCSPKSYLWVAFALKLPDQKTTMSDPLLLLFTPSYSPDESRIGLCWYHQSQLTWTQGNFKSRGGHR
jgi:hypothetical protein